MQGARPARLGARTACSSFHQPLSSRLFPHGPALPNQQKQQLGFKLAAKGSRPNAREHASPATVAGRPAMGAGSSARLRHADSAGSTSDRWQLTQASALPLSPVSLPRQAAPVCGIFASTERQQQEL